MKLIIDIPDKAYKDEKMALHFGCYSTVLHDTLYNGTPIPDNATVCDIDAIRQEIEERRKRRSNRSPLIDGTYLDCLQIIDRHMKGEHDAT